MVEMDGQHGVMDGEYPGAAVRCAHWR
jgi:hypothetical protein